MSASPEPQGGQSSVQEQEGGAGQATQALLYNQVFGDDGSDVSDMSDDDAPRPSKRQEAERSESPVAAQQDTRVDEDEEDKDEDEEKDDDEDDDERDEDAYVPGTASSAAKIPKFKKKKAVEEDEDEDKDEDDVDQEQRSRKKKHKEKKRRRERTPVQVEEEEERVYNPEEQRRMALEERIENIGKKAKVTRRKKKTDDDVDIVDSYHDDVCARLRERMLSAAERDRVSNDAKLPATAKLAMLGEVMAVLRNTTLWQSIVDNGVLEAVRQWLEPSASGALPAVGIQKAIFEVLPKMDLDTQTLKECRLGPIVLFYTKTKRVTPEINRQADSLVQAWSRPIIKRPANYRSRHVETAADIIAGRDADLDADRMDEDIDEDVPRAPVAPARKKRFDVKEALKDNEGRKGARLYVGKEIQYTVAPESKVHHNLEDLSHVSRIQMDNRKFNRFARQLKARGAR